MTEIITAAEYQQYLKKPKKSKFNNKKVTVGKIIFDSIKEYKRFWVLTDKEKLGEIKDLKRQVVFELKVNDEKICKYIADFTYTLAQSGTKVVEDVKSEHTRKLRPYRLKKKLMKAIHGIEINEW